MKLTPAQLRAELTGTNSLLTDAEYALQDIALRPVAAEHGPAICEAEQALRALAEEAFHQYDELNAAEHGAADKACFLAGEFFGFRLGLKAFADLASDGADLNPALTMYRILTDDSYCAEYVHRLVTKTEAAPEGGAQV
ncbi:MAG TPA: hypothetical protein VNT01_10170 [Symbiobacteriaceae bacterium]|nr:hypothetical protein [Symbiobacteriaceae bacterium]